MKSGHDSWCFECRRKVQKERSYSKPKTPKQSHDDYKKYGSTLRGHFARVLSVARNRCRKRGIPFNLTPEYCVELYQKQAGRCVITGKLMCYEKGQGTKQEQVSIDQIVARAGYLEDNVRLVCLQANIMKNTLSDEELRQWCSDILKGPSETTISGSEQSDHGIVQTTTH